MTSAAPGKWVAAWNRYWREPGPLLDLGATRVALVACAWIALGAWTSPAELAACADRWAWRPVWIVRLLGQGDAPPSPEAIELVFAATRAAGLLALLGLWTRAALPAFALGHLLLHAWRMSWHTDHLHALLSIALVVLACAPAGAALSLDAWLARRRGRAPPNSSASALWPLRLIGWSLAIAYASATASKLVGAGPPWLNGATLQYYAAWKGIPLGAPLAEWLTRQHALAGALCVLTVLFESTFGLAVLIPRLRWIHLPAGIAFHLLIWLTLGAPFYAFPVLYAALVPWSRGLALLRRARSGLRAGRGGRPRPAAT